jgi:hypothetical protein
VTEVFRALAEYSLQRSYHMPDHPLVVLAAEGNFEFVTDDLLRQAARESVEGIFGPPEGAE